MSTNTDGQTEVSLFTYSTGSMDVTFTCMQLLFWQSLIQLHILIQNRQKKKSVGENNETNFPKLPSKIGLFSLVTLIITVEIATDLVYIFRKQYITSNFVYFSRQMMQDSEEVKVVNTHFAKGININHISLSLGPDINNLQYVQLLID